MSAIEHKEYHRNGWKVPCFWGFASAIGAFIGALLALALFPGAAFGRNPTGQFGWHLVGFSGTIGLSFAVSQAVALFRLVQPRTPGGLIGVLLWVPVTAVGIILTIFPLWWIEGEILLLGGPLYIVMVLMPGAIVLALGQWFILRYIVAGTRIWIIRTIVGVAIGTVAGLVGALFLSPLRFEASWALGTGAGIGLLQGTALSVYLKLRN